MFDAYQFGSANIHKAVMAQKRRYHAIEAAEMAKIAIDVVLLPSEAMMDKAIEANSQLSDRKIVLDKASCLPHVSLVMGCIEKGDIAEIQAILLQIAEQCTLNRLKIVGIHLDTNSVGEKVSSFEIERSQSLQALHEEIMQNLKPYLTYDVTRDMVMAPPIGESTLRWISSYPEKSTFESFFPHITIGYGQIEAFSFPEEFPVAQLALCHLGNHCTCRKILISLPL